MAKKSLLDSFVFGALQEAKSVVDSMKGVNKTPASSIPPLPDIPQDKRMDSDSVEIISEGVQNIISEPISFETRNSNINPFRTSEQADKQADKQASKQTPEQVDKRTSKQLSGQPFKQLSAQPDNQTSRQVDKWTNEQAVKQTNKWTNEQAPEQVDNQTSGQVPDLFLFKKPLDLKLNQFQVLHYIYFCRPFKVDGSEGLTGILNIKYGTVRNCLRSLTKKGYINKPYSINDGVNIGSTCVVNEIKCLKIFGQTNIEQPDKRTSEQAPEQVDKWTNRQAPGQIDKQTSGQVKTSNNIDRQILNLKNLSVYVESSDFWKGRGLTLKKCEQWFEEIPHCDPDFLLTQLQFGEHTEHVLNSDKPVSYFRSCLLTGGLERPKGFEFPAERAARIKQLEYESLQKALSEQENFRQKQKELADKQAFLNILNDKEAVDYYVSQILEEKFVTPATKNSIKLYRETGQIDSKLEKALERKFSMTDGG